MREEEPKIGRDEPEGGISVVRDEYKTARQNEELWDSRAETYDTRYSFTRWTQKKLVSLLQLRDNPYLLDLACGTGWALRYAANRTNGQGEFYGVDNSSKMIEQAQAKSQSCGNLHFYKSRVEALPFDDDFFDVVISSNAFHHFSNPEKALREANRALKPKGKLYILDITANNAFMRLVDRFSRKMEPAHVKLYSAEEFQALFEKAGLRYITSKRIILAIEVHIGEKSNLNV
ncbi:MAG TPA: methyltransferase domain-containing protein [Candidatus Bathyarchaeia archaeon]|nr:methyltransferase domain-containing protein [Candidatus Bathyarchaeia archaeon]